MGYVLKVFNNFRGSVATKFGVIRLPGLNAAASLPRLASLGRLNQQLNAIKTTCESLKNEKPVQNILKYLDKT